MKWSVLALACAFAAASACGPGSPGGPTINNKMNAPAPQPTIVSADILAREPIANEAQVKHILIGWSGTNTDERAAKRTKQEAEAQVRTLVDQLNKGAEFEALMKQYSEDPGSAKSGIAYKVTPDAEFMIEFKQLGMRLHVGEFGVVESDYGFHIMKRVE